MRGVATVQSLSNQQSLLFGTIHDTVNRMSSSDLGLDRYDPFYGSVTVLVADEEPLFNRRVFHSLSFPHLKYRMPDIIS